VSDLNVMFSGMNASVSALQAQRQRMDVIASNLANAESTRTSKGGPYIRQQVVFEAVLEEAQNELGRQGPAIPAGGVRVASIASDPRPPVKVHMPGHPDADANGNVLMPDIHPEQEMVDLINASRSYEANSAAFKISRGLFQKALDIGK
jgi:flagellar basal-body rod protein FlgC